MEQKIKEMLNQFSETSVISNMRKSLTLITYSVVFIAITMGMYIFIFSIKGIEINNWAGMGVFLGGLATTIWAGFSEKRKQKQIEKQNENIN